MAKSRFQALRERLFLEPNTHRRRSEPIANLQAVEEVKSSTVEEVDSSAVKTTAATKIQAAVRRYNVRRSTPLIHLRKIQRVKEQFSMLRKKVEDPLYMESISVHYTEYCRFINELFHPLSVDLEKLQGVHPDVRDFQQSVIHELVEFRDVIDTSVVFASDSWVDTMNHVNVGPSNSIPHVDGVSDGSPKRMHSLDDKLTLSEQSFKRQHFEHPSDKGKALEIPVIGESEMAEHSLHASASCSSFGDRKGKALETSVIGAADDIYLGEMLENTLGGSSSRSSELNYGPILTSSLEGILDFHSERGLLRTLTAVLLIQSSFRGYKVRRFRPLKQLREVADVRARLKQLSDLLSSPIFHLKLRSDKMERLKMADCLTALFLQLETVPEEDAAVRDICQSVSTEVTNLQKFVNTLTMIVEDKFGGEVDTSLSL